MKRKNNAISLTILVLLGIGCVVAILWAQSTKHATPPEPQRQDTLVMDIAQEEPDSEDSEVEGGYDLRVGEQYMAIVNGDTAFVDIQEVEGAHIRGHVYFLPDSGAIATRAEYDFATHLFSNRLTVGDRHFSFKGGPAELRGYVDGLEHIVADKDDSLYRVQFISYVPPHYAIVMDDRYKEANHGVRISRNILYGRSEGYWTSKDWDESHNYAKAFFSGLAQTTSVRQLPLRLDLYQPVPTNEVGHIEPAPLILFIHGGAYYVGDKGDYAIQHWCRHFASMGYVCASIDYRMGFFPKRDNIARASYMALQDAHAAMRFLVHNAHAYGIDPDRLFVAGTSAGALTALDLAFMTDKDRPDASYGFGRTGRRCKGLQAAMQEGDSTDMPSERQKERLNKKNLGGIAQSGNVMTDRFHILAVANLWGAMNDLDLLSNNPRTGILSVHGDADPVVPYDEGYAFSDADINIGKTLIGKLYGGAAITRRATQLGRKASLVTLHGAGHAPHKESGRLNQAVADRIADTVASFFYEEMVPHPAAIERVGGGSGCFRIASAEVAKVMWKVEGGFILTHSPHEIRVVWRGDAPCHRLYASGLYENGIGWNAGIIVK